MKRLVVAVACVVLASCGGSIDGKKSGGGDNNENNANNANNASNAQNGTSGPNNGPNNEPDPNNVPDPINNQPTPNNEPVNNEPVNNEPVNNEPVNNEPVNNDPDPPNAMTTGDACTNAADFEAVTNSETPYIARDCQIECIEASDPRQCTADCFATNTGTGPECSLCVADFAGCGLQNCFEDCIEDPVAPQCISCLETFCDDDFVACSGIPPR